MTTRFSRLPLLGLTLAAALSAAALTGGCARPGEVGYTPVYTSKERGALILRNWDLEGKMMQDDIDYALLLRPHSDLSIWNVR